MDFTWAAGARAEQLETAVWEQTACQGLALIQGDLEIRAGRKERRTRMGGRCTRTKQGRRSQETTSALQRNKTRLQGGESG